MMRNPKALCSVCVFAITLSLSAESGALYAAEPAFEFTVSSYLGGAGFDDAVVGCRFTSGGEIVLAANLSPDAQAKLPAAKKTGLGEGRAGCILHLDAEGKKITAVTALAGRLHDMCLGKDDAIYVAAGDEGAMKLTADAAKVLWQASPGAVSRIDVGDDDTCGVVCGGKILIYDADGKQIGSAGGGQYTTDVCVHAGSKTVIQCGFRNARAFDGKKTYPVQICYLRGHAYDGELKWRNYDWSTDRASDRFLNKPTNNMADSRADRVSIGADGKLYATFQVAGGNHIFRYSPRDIMQKVELAGGDKFHQFYHSQAEHKNVVCRYEPATGEYRVGQQLCGRLSSGRANAVVTKEGDITADAAGRVYFVGKSAYGIPVNLNPTGGDYLGGGFLAVYSPDMKQRLLITRTSDGKGSPHAVATRTDAAGKTTVVYGGGGMVEGMFTQAAIQPKAADATAEKNDPQDGFFAVLKEA